MVPEHFVYVAAILNLCSTAVYVRATLKGAVQPSRVTWFCWTLAPLIAGFAQLAKGVGLSTLIVFITGFGPLLIFLSTFANKDAYWKTTVPDLFCGFLALLALIGWAITKEPNVAILLSILSDFCAAIPTFRKAWSAPHTENGPTYVLGFLSDTIGLFGVQQKSFAGYAFLAYMAVVCAVLSILVYREKFLRRLKFISD